MPPSGQPRPPISDTGTIGDYARLPTGSPNSWLRPDVLWRSRNDIVARVLNDPVDATRDAWLELGGVRTDADRSITGHEDDDAPVFVLLGDTGEGDGSQMACVPGLREVARGAHFAVICSDVIYPAGEAVDYPAKFYAPYEDLPGPIYAIPGNHDWYDRLAGFMGNFCDAVQAPPANVGRAGGIKGWLGALLWRRSSRVDVPGSHLRPRDPRFPPQRAPYWSLDAGPLRLVGVDTGISGRLDAVQGAWLERVSAERPEAAKILLTGKPILVDGRYDPGEIVDGARTVDEIVRDPAHGYVAAIGGDIHNYQRYPVELGDGRTIQYIVCGGGGAFTHATHKIRSVDGKDGLAAILREEMEPGAKLREYDTHLFPSRSWSLWWYVRLLREKLGRSLPELSHAEAGAVVGLSLDLEPLTPEGKALFDRYRRDGLPKGLRTVQKLLYEPLPAPGKLFQRFLSEIVDANRPPMAKCFLRIEVTGGALRLRCFQATGWLADEQQPPVEDDVSIPLA